MSIARSGKQRRDGISFGKIMEFHIQELSLTVNLHIRSYIPGVNSSNLCNIIDNPETFYVFSIEL